MGINNYIYNPLSIGSAGSSGYDLNFIDLPSPQYNLANFNTTSIVNVNLVDYNETTLLNFPTKFVGFTPQFSGTVNFSLAMSYTSGVSTGMKIRLYSDNTLIGTFRAVPGGGNGTVGVPMPLYPFTNFKMTAQLEAGQPFGQLLLRGNMFTMAL